VGIEALRRIAAIYRVENGQADLDAQERLRIRLAVQL
jgi:hypothetical protein